eukprot:3800341-Rhodomonas_salina.6
MRPTSGDGFLGGLMRGAGGRCRPSPWYSNTIGQRTVVQLMSTVHQHAVGQWYNHGQWYTSTLHEALSYKNVLGQYRTKRSGR